MVQVYQKAHVLEGGLDERCTCPFLVEAGHEVERTRKKKNLNTPQLYATDSGDADARNNPCTSSPAGSNPGICILESGVFLFLAKCNLGSLCPAWSPLDPPSATAPPGTSAWRWFSSILENGPVK